MPASSLAKTLIKFYQTGRVFPSLNAMIFGLLIKISVISKLMKLMMKYMGVEESWCLSSLFDQSFNHY